MQKNTFSNDSLQKWCQRTGLVSTLTLEDVALVLPNGKMIASAYAGYPGSRVSPSVIRYLFQPCYGASELPSGIAPETMCDMASVALVDQQQRTVRVPAQCTASTQFVCQLLLANGYSRA